jgi:molybdate transport system substrate-binding protein
VRVAGIFPADSHAPITYPAAIVAGQDSPLARRFNEWLRGEKAAGIYKRYGFTVK